MSVRAAPSPTALSPRAERPDLLRARSAEVCRVASDDGDDSAIVTALPEEQLMPLSRLNDGFEIELEGIAFGMADRQGRQVAMSHHREQRCRHTSVRRGSPGC